MNENEWLKKDVDSSFEEIRQEAEALNPYGVTPRYPFISIKEYTTDEAKAAILKAQKIKEFIKKKLIK